MLTLCIADAERDVGMKNLSREEAAKVLEGMKVKIEIPKAAVTQWERNAALDMAIEVLNCSEIPNKSDTISRQAALDALHTWFRDGFDEDKWWNSTHVLAAIEWLLSAQQWYKWETCFECPLSHGCPKIKCCTNEQAIEYASQIPNDCPLSTQPKYEPVKAEDFAKTMSENTIYSFITWYGTVLELIEKQGFTICKKTM